MVAPRPPRTPYGHAAWHRFVLLRRSGGSSYEEPPGYAVMRDMTRPSVTTLLPPAGPVAPGWSTVGSFLRAWLR